MAAAVGEQKQQALDEEPGLEHSEIEQRRVVLLLGRQCFGKLTAEHVGGVMGLGGHPVKAV